MRNRFFTCYSLIGVFVLSLYFFGKANAQRIPFYNLNIEDGLIQSQPDCIVQDKYGHLWIGTLGGLSRYDGRSFTNFTIRDGLSSNAIRALATDESGYLWIGSPAGVTRFSGQELRHFTFSTSDNPGANNVTVIRVGTDGTAWCIAGGKVYAIKDGKSAAFNMPDSFLFTSLMPEDGGLWLATTSGQILWVEKEVKKSLTLPAKNGRIPSISRLYKDRRGRIWVLTTAGLFYIDRDKLVEHKVGGRTLDASLWSMTEDDRNYYWVGTSSGVLRFRDSSIQLYNKWNGLSNNHFHDLFTDIEGNIWMASDGQGIFRFSGALFSGLDESMGIPSAQITGVTADKSGKVYLGTYDAGLFEYQNGTIKAIELPHGLRVSITTLATRKGSEIWIGTRGGGLWRYDSRGMKPVALPGYSPVSGSVISLYADDKDRLWVGYGNSAAIFEGDTFRQLPLQMLSAKSFMPIGEDSMLIATSSGIKLYTPTGLYPFITSTAVDDASPQCFTIRDRELWIGTSDNGIITYDMDTREVTTYDQTNGLKSDFIYNIITDDEGDVWAGTGFGIHRISFKDSQPVIYFYGKEQGVTGMESNHNAVHKMPDGSIWFGTTNGALHYNPVSKLTYARPVSIVMQSVKVFGEQINNQNFYDSTDEWYPVPYGLRLPYRQNNISFNFHAISLSGHGKLRYRYIMNGLDAPWSNWSPVSSVTYSALPPGKYDFVVQCKAGSDDIIRELHYSFEIIAPFHKTNLFTLLVLGGFMLLGITVQYIVNKRKQNRQKLLAKLRNEEQEKVRERTAEDFHDEVGNKLTRINVLANILKARLEQPPQDVIRIIDQIQDNTGQLYSGTRDILWSLQPSNDNLYEILSRIRNVGVELFQDTEIEFTTSGLDERSRQYRLPLDVSRNLIMIFKEALNNCLKYAEATVVHLEFLLIEDDVLQLKLVDNGKGFEEQNVRKGHGITNMNVRATRIRGRLLIDARPGIGTTISLTFRLPVEKKYRSWWDRKSGKDPEL